MTLLPLHLVVNWPVFTILLNGRREKLFNRMSRSDHFLSFVIASVWMYL